MKAEKVLEKFGASPGDRVRVKTKKFTLEGILLPRNIFSGEDIIILKLKNGYNVGIKVDDETKVEILAKEELPEPYEVKESLPHESGDVSFLGTGGTISAYVDYKTGAVISKMSVEAFLEVYKPLKEKSIRLRQIMSKFSENMMPNDWIKLARATKEEFDRGVKGVVIFHGTDTMSYTASALSFMFEELPGPVVLVGAQRSSDRPSTDAYLNVICASKVATDSDIGEVVVVMHGGLSDDYCLVHRGVKVRKMHSSRRDAFKSINADPIAKVFPNRIEYLSEYRERGEKCVLKDRLEEKVALIYYYPGMPPEVLRFFVDNFKGIVIAGTGLGHVSEKIIPEIKRAHELGKPVVVVTQCLYGRVNLNVYATGRDMLKAGAIPGEDMLPEVAYTKLMWVMGNYKEYEKVRELMVKNLRGEISERRYV